MASEDQAEADERRFRGIDEDDHPPAAEQGPGPCVVCGDPARHLQTQVTQGRLVCAEHKDAPWAAEQAEPVAHIDRYDLGALLKSGGPATVPVWRREIEPSEDDVTLYDHPPPARDERLAKALERLEVAYGHAENTADPHLRLSSTSELARRVMGMVEDALEGFRAALGGSTP